MPIGIVDHPEEAEVKEELQQIEKTNQSQNSDISSLKKTVKTLFNRSQFVDIISLLAVLVMTVVLSLLSVGWDISKIGWQAFVVNLSFLLFLGIFGLFYGEKSGRTFFKNWAKGAFQGAKIAFNELKNKIVGKGYADCLPDYISWRYEKDCLTSYKMKLMSIKVFDMRVLDINDEAFEELKHRTIKIKVGDKDVYIKRLSPEQAKVVEDIRNGELKIDYIDDYSFFLTDAPSDGTQLVKKIKQAEVRKRKIERRQRISKLSLIILLSIVFAGVFVDQMTGQSASQILLNLFSRITTLTTSIICGFNTARILNLIDIEVLRFKISYLQVFFISMVNKTFKPIDKEEEARREYEREEKERQEVLASIIDVAPRKTTPLLVDTTTYL